MAGSSGKPGRHREWRQYQGKIENEYTRQIQETSKKSVEQRLLFQKAYSQVIGNLIDQHEPRSRETNHTDTVVGIVKALAASSRKQTVTVFDLGCGSGQLLVELARDNHDVYGIDVSEASIAQAKQVIRPFAKPDRVRHGDILDYIPPKKFDIIVMANVIDHFMPDETPDVLAKCYEMLGQEGFLVTFMGHLLLETNNKCILSFGSVRGGGHFEEFLFTGMNEALTYAGFQEVWDFPVHPRVFGQSHPTPGPSEWAARKSIMLERVAQKSDSSPKGLKLERPLRTMETAAAFPIVAVGVKRLSGLSNAGGLSM